MAPTSFSAPRALLLVAGLLAATLTVSVRPAGAAAPPTLSSSDTTLTGTLQLTPGSCAGGKVTGSYIRMILPSGGPNGPYMSNSDSRCSDQSFTTLSPGVDGGLVIGSYQANPTPAFTADGDARANRITAPQPYYGTGFATSTNPTDPQTKTRVSPPRLTLSGSTLSGDLRSFSVSWNNQYFNQGAPKPDGSLPGLTRAPSGTYDAATGAFTLNWSSRVVGGPFDKFTGQWHFEGRFVPSSGATSTSTSTSPGTDSASPGTGAAGVSDPVGASAADPGTGDAGAAAAETPGPGAAPLTGDPVAGTAMASGTTVDTVTRQNWSVSWPVVWLAGGIALVGFGALIALSLSGRRSRVAR